MAAGLGSANLYRTLGNTFGGMFSGSGSGGFYPYGGSNLDAGNMS
jgi:hypothetical protein